MRALWSGVVVATAVSCNSESPRPATAGPQPVGSPQTAAPPRTVEPPPASGPIRAGSDQYKFNQQLKSAVVLIRSHQKAGASYESEGEGSGFFVSSEGLVVTNAHVVQSKSGGIALKVVQYPDREHRSVQCLHVDAAKDLALLRIAGSGRTPFLALRESLPVQTSPVLVIGHPMGEHWSISSGTITGAREQGGSFFLGTDARIEPGNSGGPMVLRQTAEVVGVSDWKIRGTGMNYAIRGDAVLSFVKAHFKDSATECGVASDGAKRPTAAAASVP